MPSLGRPRRFGRTKLEIDQIESALAPAGYVWTEYAKKVPVFGTVLNFVRLGSQPGFFEHVLLRQYGEGREVGLMPRLMLVPTTNQWVGMSEEFWRGEDDIHPIASAQEIRELFDGPLSQLPARHRALSDETLPRLAESTRTARSAAAFYAPRLPRPSEELLSQWTAWKERASDELRNAARTMLRSGLLALDPDNPDEKDREFASYQIAVYTIVDLALRGEGPFAVNDDPYKTRDLAWCIQILASRTYRRDLWTRFQA